MSWGWIVLIVVLAIVGWVVSTTLSFSHDYMFGDGKGRARREANKRNSKRK